MGGKFSEFTHPLTGKRVEVISRGKYGPHVLHESGVVRAVYSMDSIAVDLDFVANPGSKHGWFYFREEELVLDVIISSKETTAAATAEEGERNMSKLTNYLNVAVIQFLNDDRPFHTIECANYEADLEKGDLCVVMSAKHGMGLAEVVEIKETPEAELRREIVAKVHTGGYDTRVEMRKKSAELKAKMQERAKQLQDVVLYQTLAKEDPYMAQLLQEFQLLSEV